MAQVVLNVPTDVESVIKFYCQSMDLGFEQVCFELFVEGFNAKTTLRRRVLERSLFWVRAVAAYEDEIQKRALAGKAKVEAQREKDLKRALANIDYGVLETSSKTKSRYAYVHPALSGRGFRALVHAGGKWLHLKTWPLPEQAAWERYQWIMERGLPYGKEEGQVATLINNGADPDLALAIVRLGSNASNDDLNQFVATVREKRKRLAEFPMRSRRGRPPKMVELLALKSGIVSRIEPTMALVPPPDGKIVVEHDDGSRGFYRNVFRIEVNVGAQVEAGMQIGFLLGGKSKPLYDEMSADLLQHAPKPEIIQKRIRRIEEPSNTNTTETVIDPIDEKVPEPIDDPTPTELPEKPADLIAFERMKIGERVMTPDEFARALPPPPKHVKGPQPGPGWKRDMLGGWFPDPNWDGPRGDDGLPLTPDGWVPPDPRRPPPEPPKLMIVPDELPDVLPSSPPPDDDLVDELEDDLVDEERSVGDLVAAEDSAARDLVDDFGEPRSDDVQSG